MQINGCKFVSKDATLDGKTVIKKMVVGRARCLARSKLMTARKRCVRCRSTNATRTQVLCVDLRSNFSLIARK